MHIITKKSKSEDKSYVYVVATKRCKDKVRTEYLAYLGLLDNDSLPYLKAAFMPKEKRPKLGGGKKNDG